MDKETIGAISGVAAVGGVALHWLYAMFKGGKRMAEERSETLRQARDHTDAEIDKARAHEAQERDKLWSEVRDLRREASADRVALTAVQATVEHIKATVDRIDRKLDGGGR